MVEVHFGLYSPPAQEPSRSWQSSSRRPQPVVPTCARSDPYTFGGWSRRSRFVCHRIEASPANSQSIVSSGITSSPRARLPVVVGSDNGEGSPNDRAEHGHGFGDGVGDTDHRRPEPVRLVGGVEQAHVLAPPQPSTLDMLPNLADSPRHCQSRKSLSGSRP